MKLKKIICLIFIMVCIFDLSACTNAETGEGVVLESASSVEKEFSSWISYWDIDRGIKELSKASDKLSSVSVFALYFNNDGSIYTPENIPDKYGEISGITNKENINLYVCVVNDVVDETGNIIQKDPNIIRRLIGDPNQRTRHIDELVSFAVNNKYFGIEIDYEKLDDDIWPDFVLFCDELDKKCKERSIDLRVILEPRAPIDRFTLPDGPEYIMMAYNLYGLSTEPGPKADMDFIKELSQKMNNLSGKKWFAFATGGFDWQTGGGVSDVTEAEALDIISVYGCLPARDEKSGCLYFYYTDQKGKDHTVWYADNVTLDLWKKTAEECGLYNICLWKLGGNVSETINQFKENFAK